MDDEYDGPCLVLTCSCVSADSEKSSESESKGPMIPLPSNTGVVRVVKVKEDDVLHEMYPVEAIPLKL